MKKTIALLIVVFGIILCLSACGIADNSEQTQQSQTGITSLKFATLSSPVNLEASKTKTGYFKVECNGDFSIDDIEFVSTNKSVASFEYDETALNTCIYYTITGLSEGEATIYAQTKDGIVRTSEITVKVTGFIYKVEKIEDTSFSWEGRNIIRKSLMVTVDEDYFDSLRDQSEFLKYIATQYASSHKVNNVAVYLFGTDDNLDAGGYTLAMCNYGPYGDILKATEIEAGDYTNFDFKIQIREAWEREAMRQPD